MDLTTILTRCGVGSKDPERGSVYESGQRRHRARNNVLMSWSRPKWPLGVSHSEPTGRGKRCRPIHYDGHDTLGECAICLGDITHHRELYETPCLHAFHHSCAMQYAISRFRGGRPSTACPLCRAPLTSTFETAEQVPGVPTTGTHVYLHALVDVWQNGHVYAVEDENGGRFASSSATSTVANRPSALVHINVYAGWFLKGGRSDAVRLMPDSFVVPRPNLADENRRLRAELAELRRALGQRTEATAPNA